MILQISKLTIADEFLRIMRRKNMIIILLNKFTAKLDNILFVSDIEINLLFIQALLVQRIKNHNLIQKVKFNQTDKHKIIVKDSHKDKINYLTWVKNEKTLFNEKAIQVSKNICKNQQKKSGKQLQKINFENKKQLTKLVKKINSELLHQQLRHVRMLKHILKTVRDIKIQNELSKNCKICMHAQKTKVQNHETVKLINKSAKRLHIDFWSSYWHDNVNDSKYILMITDDCIWHEWIFTIKNQNFETLISILKSLIKWIEHKFKQKIKWFRMNNAKKFHELAR